MIPDQITGDALRETVRRYKKRIEKLPTPPDTSTVTSVEGGVLKANPLGWAHIECADSTLHAPKVSFQIEDVTPDNRYYVETTPSRLVRVDGDWRMAEAKITTIHSFYATASHIRLTFLSESAQFVMTPPQRAELRDETVYAIPPAAQKIVGEGVVRYASGHEIRVRKGHATRLPRPSATGGLTIRPSPLYAEFVGQHPAEALVGQRWVPLEESIAQYTRT